MFSVKKTIPARLSRLNRFRKLGQVDRWFAALVDVMTALMVGNPKRSDGPAWRSGPGLGLGKDEALRREIAERAVRPLGIGFEPEVLDDDSDFGQDPELFALRAFVAEAGAKRFDETVLPRARRRAINGFDSVLHQPVLKVVGDELGVIFGPDELGVAVLGDTL